jgi:hypothetical protein
MGDKSVVPLAPANSWSLIGQMPGTTPTGGAAPAAAPPAPPAPPPSPFYGPPGPMKYGGQPTTPPLPRPRQPSVEVIRGGQREIVTPGQYGD